MSRPPTTWTALLAPLRQLNLPATREGYSVACGVVEATSNLNVPTSTCPNSEVVGDLLLLAQHLQQRHVSGERTAEDGSGDEFWRPQTQYCKLLVHHIGSKTVVFPAAALSILVPAVRQWIFCDIGSTSTLESLQVGALEALNMLLQSCDGKLPPHEQQALMIGLLTLAEEAATPAANYYTTSKLTKASTPTVLEKGGEVRFSEVIRLVFQVLSIMLSKFQSSDLPKDSHQVCASAAVGALEACLGRSFRPVEDARASRFYATLLRCLNTAIMEGRGCHVPLLNKLAILLPRFFLYGVHSTSVTAAPSTGVGKAEVKYWDTRPSQSVLKVEGSQNAVAVKSAYVPPHVRLNKAKAVRPLASNSEDQRSRPREGRDSGWRESEESSSETDTSDMENGTASGGTFPADLHRSSRVRTAALNTIQAIVRSDVKAVQPHICSFLPLNSPLQQHPRSPSLVTVLLYDPHAKVRSCAATAIGLLVDGPAQRAYLGVAEGYSLQGAGAWIHAAVGAAWANAGGASCRSVSHHRNRAKFWRPGLRHPLSCSSPQRCAVRATSRDPHPSGRFWHS